MGLLFLVKEMIAVNLVEYIKSMAAFIHVFRECDGTHDKILCERWAFELNTFKSFSFNISIRASFYVTKCL